MEGEEKEIPEDLKHSQQSHRFAAQIHAISGSQKENNLKSGIKFKVNLNM